MERTLMTRQLEEKRSRQRAGRPSSLIDRLLPVLFEDDHLIALNKPAGVDVGDADDPQPTDLIECLRRLQSDASWHVVNRLSRYESGVLIFAKHRAGAEKLRSALRAARVPQEYLAVVRGRMKRPNMRIAPADESNRDRTSRMPSRRRTPASAGPGETSAKSREAQFSTELQLLGVGENRTLIRCRTNARTTHALRARLRGAKLRLLGDPLHDPGRERIPQSVTCLHLGRTTVPHPVTGANLLITSPPPSFQKYLCGETDVDRPLHAALVRRLPCLLDPETNCLRLLTGDFEDVPGLSAERFGPVIILQASEPAVDSPDFLRRVCRWYRERLPIEAVYVKRFVRDRCAFDAELTESLHDPEPLWGRPAPATLEVLERGLRFAVRPYEGFSVGLFLDQRENRSCIRSLSDGKEVLNLFAYTCGFSVAAASGGAAKVVSVDLSGKHLDRGRENFLLNDLHPSAHEFVRSDVMDYIARADRRERGFDLVILDPPTFAHGRQPSRSFSVTRDMAELLRRSFLLLRPGGIAMICTNHRRTTWRALRGAAHAAARGRKHEILDSPGLPLDFAVDRDHAKTILVQFP